MTKECEIILKNGYGYRDDTVYGSGITNPIEIMSFEILELCNLDIPKTLNSQFKKYGYNFKTYDYKTEKKILEMVEHNKQELLKLLIGYFNLNRLNVSAYWLCATKQDVKKIYNGDYPTKYKFDNNNYIILSDLGIDGVLVVSKTWHIE